MKYYKCLVDSYSLWIKNGIYSEDSLDGNNISKLIYYVRNFPRDWELVTISDTITITDAQVDNNYEIY